MELDMNAYSVFLLHYHLILVMKYRKQVFTDEISERAKEIFSYIAPNYKIEMKKMFWSQSFCLLSSGGAPIEVISKNISKIEDKRNVS